MPRFVLLHHECPAAMGKPSHWDLMLERDGVLATWSLPTLPRVWREPTLASAASSSNESLPATRLADHRIAYLDYEGPISGERGVVSRHDGGEYRVLAESDDALRIEVRGEMLIAEAELRREAGGEWVLIVSAPARGRGR